jgi:uncharacterized phage infection (PIP) family protein YhgE
MPNKEQRFSMEDVIDAFTYGVRLGGNGEDCTQLATKQDVRELKLEIKNAMATLAEQLTAVNTGLETIGAGVDEVLTVVTNVSGDVTSLKAIIEKLQTNPGPITPEDQALLDKAQALVGTTSTKLQGAVDALKALDAATEPVVEEPPTDPVPPTP